MSTATTLRRYLDDIEPNRWPRAVTEEADVAVRADAIEEAGYPHLADILRSLPVEGPIDFRGIRKRVWSEPVAGEIDEIDMNATEGPLQHRAAPRAPGEGRDG